MKDKNRIDRPNLIFEQMDATSMSFIDEKFSVIIDKGTLDALMPDDSIETQKTIDKFFNEITRVLCRGGRYICISLLQEHILRKFVSYFALKNFMLRITRCHEAENKTKNEEGSSIPVFSIMATKFPGIKDKILELSLTDDSPIKVKNEDELINSILSVQQSALVCDRLSKKNVSDVGEINLDLYQPGNDNPRYKIYILDKPNSNGKTYAAFLVPQGRETDWLFSTSQGRKEFLGNVDKDRVAIVVLGRNHTFNNWDDIKIELSPSIKNLSPSGLSKNYIIDYLSLGADIGKRELIYQGESKYSGKYLIEDVIDDDSKKHTRRLVFLDNQFVVQSEAEMKLSKNRRGKRKLIVNPGVLSCEYHPYMSVGINSLMKNSNEIKNILVIGLGGGGLCLFLNNCYEKLNITAVEIDEAMLKIATNWFDFVQDNRTSVCIDDGIEYINNAALNNKKFDAILFDVDSKDPSLGMCCPPQEFLDTSVLSNVSKCLNDDGIFILNFVCRDKNLRPGVLNKLTNTFTSITSMKMNIILNEIFMCTNVKKNIDQWKNEWKESVVDFNQRVKSKKLLNDDIVDVAELLDELTIEV